MKLKAITVCIHVFYFYLHWACNALRNSIFSARKQNNIKYVVKVVMFLFP